LDVVSDEDFMVEVNREIIKEIARFANRGEAPKGPDFLESLSEPARARWTSLSVREMHTPRDVESVLDCLANLVDSRRKRRLAELEERVPGLLAKGDLSEEERGECQELMELRRYFSDRTGRDVAGTI
jgi:hypothetical protein